MNAVAVQYFDERKGFWRIGKVRQHVGMGANSGGPDGVRPRRLDARG
jgi:hypothetical protein